MYRILRIGGCFRVIVPDAELVLQRYFDAPRGDSRSARHWCGNPNGNRQPIFSTTLRTPVRLRLADNRENAFASRICSGLAGRRLVRAASARRSFLMMKSMNGKVSTLKQSNLSRIDTFDSLPRNSPGYRSDFIDAFPGHLESPPHRRKPRARRSGELACADARHARKREIEVDWTFYCILGQPGAMDDKARALGARVIHSPVPIVRKARVCPRPAHGVAAWGIRRLALPP